MSRFMEQAFEHHRDACLDNHSERDCAAVIFAAKLTKLDEAHQPNLSWLRPEIEPTQEHRDSSACKGCRIPGVGTYHFANCPVRKILDGES